ncbi:MAG TPA: von Willebrand factor type A domain-containing protein [Chitinophagaceae bacterium]|nr:von Willebrand factor type A domain-containing protein [Chitinophagaceae bacterium]
MRTKIITLVILIGCCLVSIRCDKDLAGGISSFSISQGDARLSTVEESPFIKTADSATSTFSIDADGASYALMRKFISSGRQPVKDAIRSEEFMNYFTYNYSDPSDNTPIAVNGEVSSCPWTEGNKLIRIGIKGKSTPLSEYPLANFVLLIDVSGSMQTDNKLELLKKGFIEFVNQMRPNDRIAIVTYAGDAGLVLNSTTGAFKEIIKSKIDKLKPGGSTNGAAGINLAYQLAKENFINGGNNRVILGTDGDFNVGVSSQTDLENLIISKRDQGIFLTVLGVGTDNLNEAMMEQVANKGNGNYEYIDDLQEIKKVFIDEYSKFLTVAKDVKIQVTFNPSLVEEYRLIGYENRKLTTNDFTDDKKDAGEVGSGQTITALYEIKPVANMNFHLVPTFTINFRYKKPSETISNLLSLDIYDAGTGFELASENMRFSASCVALSMYLRESPYKGTLTISKLKSWTSAAVSFDPNGYRARHLQLLSNIR